MIPQNLIDKIHQGRAEFKTFCAGLGGNMIIECPKKSYIVILKFTYSHFIDLPKIFTETDKLKNNVHNVQFKSSNKNRYNYTFRTNFAEASVSKILFITNPAEIRECYQVHDSHIHIDIWRMTTAQNFGNVVSAVANLRTNNESPPLSYGTPADVGAVASVRTGLLNPPTAEYHPQGDVSGLPTINGYRNQLIGDLDVNTGLVALDPTTPTPAFINYQYPILNIDYILVNEQTLETTK